MSRLTVIVVVLMALLWQSIAMARIGSTVNVLADPAHAALHWQEAGHHHHDDGSYHTGDAVESTDSTQHVLMDPVSGATALLVMMSQGLPALGSVAPVAEHRAPAPDPMIDGLLRPPRAHA